MKVRLVESRFRIFLKNTANRFSPYDLGDDFAKRVRVRAATPFLTDESLIAMLSGKRAKTLVALLVAGVLEAGAGIGVHGALADDGEGSRRGASFILPDDEVQPPNSNSDNIAKLIKQLGSTTYQERATAQKELEAIGVPALEELKRALPSADLETSRRAAALIRRIEERKNTQEALSPKLVRLNLVNVPVEQAVDLLAEQTGYHVDIRDEKAKYTGKRVTLDAGPVPFWKAIDAICEQAGLRERPPLSDRVGIPARGMDLIMWQPGYRSGDLPVVVPNEISLHTAARVKMYTSLAGSVRLRLYEIPGDKAEDFGLLLDIAPEPRLLAFRVEAAPSFLRALDDQGQERYLKGAKTVHPEGRQWLLQFLPAPKPAKKLKLLQGDLSAQILARGDVTAVIDGLSKAQVRSEKTKDAALVRVDPLRKTAADTYEVRLVLDLYADAPRRRVPGASPESPELDRLFLTKLRSVDLVDAQGNPFQAVGVPYYSGSSLALARGYTFHFRADAGQGVPEKLIIHGSTPVTVTVPFAFANVALE